MRATKNQFLLLLLAVSVFAATAWTTGCKNKDKETDTGERTNGGDGTGGEGATEGDTSDDPGDDDGDDPVVDEVEFGEDPDVVRIDEDVLFKRYPAGKEWRGSSEVQVSGKASNLDFNLKAVAAFGYTSNVNADVEVLSNDRNTIVFDVQFNAVIQVLVIDSVEVQLVPPTPEQKMLLQFADFAVKRILAKTNPALLVKYVLVTEGLKAGAKGVNTLDPGLKETLSYLLENRFDVTGEVEVLKSRFAKLSLKRFRVEYVNGFGVTKITQLDEVKVFKRSQMLRLKNYVSVFLDYHIWPPNTEVGDQYEVDASDIAGILILAPDADMTGQISLRRDKDKSSDTAMVTVTEGTLTYEMSSDKNVDTTNVSTPGGYFLVDKNNYLVTYARVNLAASRIVASKDHLLFGSEKEGKVEANAFYEARMLTEGESIRSQD